MEAVEVNMRSVFTNLMSDAGSRKLALASPRRYFLRLVVVVVSVWMLGELVGIGIESALDKTGKCKLPREVEEKLRSKAGGQGQLGLLVVKEEEEDVPCEARSKPVSEDLDWKMITGEILSEYRGLEEIIFAYNSFVTIGTRNKLQYIHRPFFNVRSTSGEIIDFVETLLSFGRKETNLVDLYYASDLEFRQVHLPFTDEDVDHFVNEQISSRRGKERLLFIRNVRTEPRFHRSFLYSGPWFRAKYKCSKLRAIKQSEFHRGRLTVALSVEDISKNPKVSLSPMATLCRRIVLLLESYLRQPVAVDVHVFIETASDEDSISWAQDEFKKRFQCKRCGLHLHKYSTTSLSHQLVAFKHLVEADVLIPSPSDMSLVASAFSRNIKVIGYDSFETDGMIYVVPAIGTAVVERTFRQKFNKRFSGVYELSEFPGESDFFPHLS
mmetsp:Transcript_6820/g.20737  ORF Transcript_6820/g.20737 Transcript_6820/m.20737 type:complete len:439 (-) Transcript_6820:1656-2972(-)